MTPLVRLFLAISLVCVGLLFASPASAQTCQERRNSLSLQENRAQALRRSVSSVRNAPTISLDQLDFWIRTYSGWVTQTSDPAERRRLALISSYLQQVRYARERGLPPPDNRSALADLDRQRDIHATNISHGRAAMESMRCGATAGTDPGATSASGCQGFSGVWNTNWGVVTIRGTAGSYVYRGINSTLSGTVQGRRYSGQYHQPGYPDPEYVNGEVIFTLSADGQSWAGESWNRSRTVMYPWSGTCAGPAR